MSGIKGLLDGSGLYYANVISKNGRNEVQIYPINQEVLETPVMESLVVKVELAADEVIGSSCWMSGTVGAVCGGQKKGKRKLNLEDEVARTEGGGPSGGLSDGPGLLVGLENGEILVVSPHESGVLKKVSYESSIDSLSQSVNNHSVWGIDRLGDRLVEVSLEQGRELKQFKLKEKESLNLVKVFNYKPSLSRSQTMLVGTENLYLVDPSKPKRSLLVAFPKHSATSKIDFIENSKVKDEAVAVHRSNEPTIFLYNIENPETVGTLKVSTPKLHNLKFIVDQNDKETIMAFTLNGIEVFPIDHNAKYEKEEPSCLIKTNFHDSEDKILFTDVFFRNNELFGVWYDNNEPRFAPIPWTSGEVGEIQVQIDFTKKIDSIEKRVGSIQFPEPKQVNNLTSDRLYKKLSAVLMSSESKHKDVLELCLSNDNEENIKGTIKLFSTSECSSKLIPTLFEIISKEVAAHPAKKSSLSAWLKWLLLAQGGHIAKQPDQFDNLKNLQAGLAEGMKLMPRLLALNGRLQLLKSQTQIRNNVKNDISDSDSDSDTDIKEDQDENITYLNGESDDVEVADADSVNGLDEANEFEED